MSTKRAGYRIGRRTGQAKWQLKEGPAWKVIFASVSFAEVAGYALSLPGVTAAGVTVVDRTPWASLQDLIAAGEFSR